MTILLIKLVHALLFGLLSACVLHVLYSGLTGRTTRMTLVATVAVAVEGLALALNGWRCPLTTLAERHGAEQGSVAPIFLPDWFHVFPICGALFALVLAGLVVHRLRRGAWQPTAKS